MSAERPLITIKKFADGHALAEDVKKHEVDIGSVRLQPNLCRDGCVAVMDAAGVCAPHLSTLRIPSQDICVLV